MEAFSAILDLYGGSHRSPLNSPHTGQWRGALMFSLICGWTSGWANNQDASHLRCRCAHYDVTVITDKMHSTSSCPSLTHGQTLCELVKSSFRHAVPQTAGQLDRHRDNIENNHVMAHWTKWTPFCRSQFQKYLRNRKCWILFKIS